MELSRKESTIEIKIEVLEYKEGSETYFVGHVLEPEQLTGCICQAKSEKELKENLDRSVRAMISFYEQDHQTLHKRAIWLSNHHENHFWFKILGIGLTINWTSGEYITMKKGWKYFGITKPGGLRIGKLLIFPQNAWKWPKKKKIK